MLGDRGDSVLRPAAVIEAARTAGALVVAPKQRALLLLLGANFTPFDIGMSSAQGSGPM
jgi:hypothetical protein